jgi:hypothetical protein
MTNLTQEIPYGRQIIMNKRRVWGPIPLSPGILFMEATIKDDVFWDMTPCGSSKKNRSFEGTLLQTSPEGDMFLLNAGSCYYSHTVSYPRRQLHSQPLIKYIPPEYQSSYHDVLIENIWNRVRRRQYFLVFQILFCANSTSYSSQYFSHPSLF